MTPYLVSLAAGLLVGGIYGLLNVRSPAPPVIALVGLLGMLVGEQVVPMVKRVMSAQRAEATPSSNGSGDEPHGRIEARTNP